MIIYLLKSTLYLLIFYGFYKVLLSKLTFFSWNRAYLLITPLLALILPLVVFEIPDQSVHVFSIPAVEHLSENIVNIPETKNNSTRMGSSLSILYVLWVLGSAISLLFFIKSIVTIIKLKKTSEGRYIDDLHIFVSDSIREPFSFLKHIYLPRDLDLEIRSSRLIVEHEKEHVNQKHSFDLIYLQILKTIFWFQPLFHLYEKSIKLNHEHLVDQQVSKLFSIKEYGYVLLSQLSPSYSSQNLSCIHTFYHSPLKQRIIMMTKITNRNKKWFYLCILPLTALIILVNCQKTDVVSHSVGDSEDIISLSEDQSVQFSQNTDKGPIFSVVENQPYFGGCDEIEEANDRRQCANKKLLESIYREIKYPIEARKSGTQGRVTIAYVVEKDGSLGDVQVLQDPGAGLGQEVKRTFESLNSKGLKWVPGQQRGQVVRVQYQSDVMYQLQGEDGLVEGSNKSKEINITPYKTDEFVVVGYYSNK